MSSEGPQDFESQSVEFKSSWRDEYLEWICGFANAQGGTLYIGIADDGSVAGLGDARRLLEDIPNKIAGVLGIVAPIRLHEDFRGTYLEIEVSPQVFPVSCRGRYYIRAGATNQLLRGAALDTFLLRKQGSSWDAAPVPGLTPDALSPEAAADFVARATKLGRIPDAAAFDAPEDLIAHLRLTRDGYLTNAAALLFGADPDACVPGSSVKIGFFEGTEIIYQDEVKGPALQQADKVLDLLYLKYLRAKIGYEGIHRVERYPFPRAAVREAVVNAIAHKNYTSGAPVQIRVYDDKLMVCNACILPAGWELEDLLGFHASEPHNPKVANVLFLAGFIESWGRGVQKIIAECKLDGIDPPVFRLSGGSLIVEFTAPEERVVRTDGRLVVDGSAQDSAHSSDKQRGNSDKATSSSDKKAFGSDKNDTGSDKILGRAAATQRAEERVLAYLEETGEAGSLELSELTGMTRRGVQKLLGRLAGRGLVFSFGANKNRRYRLTKSEGSQQW